MESGEWYCCSRYNILQPEGIEKDAIQLALIHATSTESGSIYYNYPVPRDFKSRGTLLKSRVTILRDFFFCQYRLSEHDLSFKHIHDHRLRHIYGLGK